MKRPRLGNIISGRRNDRGGAVSAHPGKLDRMKGGKSDGASGPSHPDYLPHKRRRS